MYGLVNKAIKEYAKERFGKAIWEETFQELKLSDTQFISLESNPDQLTRDIMGKICNKTGMAPTELAEQIGEFFLDFSCREGYEDLLNLAGDTLPELLNNLNELHFRIRALMPNLNPPRFEVSDQTDHSLKLHYFSNRDGFDPFLTGTLKGLFKKFRLNATFKKLPPESLGEKCILEIIWE